MGQENPDFATTVANDGRRVVKRISRGDVARSVRRESRVLVDYVAELAADGRNHPFAFDDQGLAFLAMEPSDPAKVQLQERE